MKMRTIEAAARIVFIQYLEFRRSVKVISFRIGLPGLTGRYAFFFGCLDFLLSDIDSGPPRYRPRTEPQPNPGKQIGMSQPRAVG